MNRRQAEIGESTELSQSTQGVGEAILKVPPLGTDSLYQAADLSWIFPGKAILPLFNTPPTQPCGPLSLAREGDRNIWTWHLCSSWGVERLMCPILGSNQLSGKDHTPPHAHAHPRANATVCRFQAGR